MERVHFWAPRLMTYYETSRPTFESKNYFRRDSPCSVDGQCPWWRGSRSRSPSSGSSRVSRTSVSRYRTHLQQYNLSLTKYFLFAPASSGLFNQPKLVFFNQRFLPLFGKKEKRATLWQWAKLFHVGRPAGEGHSVSPLGYSINLYEIFRPVPAYSSTKTTAGAMEKKRHFRVLFLFSTLHSYQKAVTSYQNKVTPTYFPHCSSSAYPAAECHYRSRDPRLEVAVNRTVRGSCSASPLSVIHKHLISASWLLLAAVISSTAMILSL